jgi:hypothetical protein
MIGNTPKYFHRNIGPEASKINIWSKSRSRSKAFSKSKSRERNTGGSVISIFQNSNNKLSQNTDNVSTVRIDDNLTSVKGFVDLEDRFERKSNLEKQSNSGAHPQSYAHQKSGSRYSRSKSPSRISNKSPVSLSVFKNKFGGRPISFMDKDFAKAAKKKKNIKMASLKKPKKAHKVSSSEMFTSKKFDSIQERSVEV